MTLELVAISKYFRGVAALRDISASFEAGVTAILGGNGAGKSTLLDVICGIIAPSRGVLRWRGGELPNASVAHRARAGIVRLFQEPQLSGSQRPEVNVLIAARPRSTDGLVTAARRWSAADKQRRGAARSLLDEFGFGANIERTTSELSGGFRRLLSFACCIAQRPDVLLLDEPLAGLGSARRADVLQHIDRERQRGVTVLLVEHDLNAVRAIADRAVVLSGGVKIADGSVTEAIARLEATD